jgi:(p)ppGpp synthase/HD superfamily hydrolase
MTPPGVDAALERSDLVRAALAVARQAHAGHVRNGSAGLPYIDHPLAVAELLAEHGFPDDVLAAALLHDVVEDSELELEQVRERFGAPVGRLVEVLTDSSSTEPYAKRKEEHRRGVERAGRDAHAIYAADKLTNIRMLRDLYELKGERAGEELKAPLDEKVEVWRQDLEMLQRTAADVPFLDSFAEELAALSNDRAARQAPSR